MTTLRLEQRWKIGDAGAVYEFDVKLPLLEAPLLTQDRLEIDTQITVEEFATELRRRYNWVGNVYLTGRSAGWLAIEDTTGGATEAKLAAINQMVDKAYDDFVKYLNEEFGKVKTPPLTDPGMRKRIAFFKERAMYVVGRQAEGAVALARAEYTAEEVGWHGIWEEDPDGMDSIGDVDPEEIEEILVCVLVDEDGESLGSLGGIINPDRTIRRVTEAELALEALHEKGLL